jgi:hypothetical protein
LLHHEGRQLGEEFVGRTADPAVTADESVSAGVEIAAVLVG